MALSFAKDIRPLFSEGDVKCMAPAGVHLDDPSWMRVAANAHAVYEVVSNGSMPPGAPWPEERVKTFTAWMDEGFPA